MKTLKAIGIWMLDAIKKYSKQAFALFVVAFLIIGMYLIVYSCFEKASYDRYHFYSSYEIFQETNHLRYDSLKLQLSNEVVQ